MIFETDCATGARSSGIKSYPQQVRSCRRLFVAGSRAGGHGHIMSITFP